MHVLVYILLWTTVCCYRCFHERKSCKLERPIGWRGSNERKYCQLKAGNVLWKNFEPFSRNLSSNRMSYKLMTRFRPIKCFPLSLLLWTPGRQTCAANWLTRFMWKQLLSIWREKVSWKNFEPFWSNIISKIVMSWKLLPKCRQITWFCYLCFYGRQADKLARPISWLGSCEKKYCLLGARKVSWKKFEPFWRNVTSKIVFSCMFLSIYCYERLFAVTDVSMNANRTN